MNNNKKVSLNRDIGQLGFAAIALNGVIGANISLMVTYAGWFWAPLESGLGHKLAVAVTLCHAGGI